MIALFGPTAIGKTAIAIELAKLLRGRGEDPVAVSVDSMQVYRELPILTGAADAAQRAELEHRLIGHVSVADRYDVARHARLAHAEIDQLRREGRRPIVVGGTGLYLRAALVELDLRPKPQQGVRERLEAEFERDGAEGLHRRLTEIAPDVAATLDPRDVRRVVRALEVAEQGELTERDENRLWTDEMRVPTGLFALVAERQVLYGWINERTDEIVSEGAEDEVRGALPLAGKTARQALGFDELIEGDIEALKARTRQYAKRQLTWLNKLAGAHQIDVTEQTPAETAAVILAEISG